MSQLFVDHNRAKTSGGKVNFKTSWSQILEVISSVCDGYYKFILLKV